MQTLEGVKCSGADFEKKEGFLNRNPLLQKIEFFHFWKLSTLVKTQILFCKILRLINARKRGVPNFCSKIGQNDSGLAVPRKFVDFSLF